MRAYVRASKSNGYQHPNGYVYVSQQNRGAVAQHRVVMEEKLGRALRTDETVHHKNGVRNDNRVENLELWSRWHPPGQRVEDLVTWAKEVLEQYDT